MAVAKRRLNTSHHIVVGVVGELHRGDGLEVRNSIGDAGDLLANLFWNGKDAAAAELVLGQGAEDARSKVAQIQVDIEYANAVSIYAESDRDVEIVLRRCGRNLKLESRVAWVKGQIQVRD